jgi:hypothetical protein
MRPRLPALPVVAVAAALAAAAALPATASDHADPLGIRVQESGLTGLFFFPDGDDMILVLAARRALTGGGPYDVEPYEYRVFMDLHSEVTYTDPADRARYGGTVTEPAAIRPDVTIRLRLDDDGSLREHGVEGLHDPQAIRAWAGVRDDPFIFPRFFGTNVLAMVLAIPRSSFPTGREDWILWGATFAGDEQVDHVGRSNRTQNARLDFLNTLPPSEHLDAIHAATHRTDAINAWLAKWQPTQAAQQGYHLLLQVRHYDDAPDVMIFTTRLPPGFPNGRRLTDDVAALTCQVGDCTLMELSYTESPAFPRETTNDKDFLDAFPYLAAPWPEKAQAPPPTRLWGCWALWAALLLLAILLLVALRTLRRLRYRPRPA